MKAAINAFKRRAPNLLRHSSFSKYYFTKSKKSVTTDSHTQQDQLTVNQHVSKNLGLQRFLQKAYKTTALSTFGSLGISYTVAMLPITAAKLLMLAKVGVIGGLVGIIGSFMMKPEILSISEQLNSTQRVQILVSVNTFRRKLLYVIGVIGIGLSASPIIAVANLVNPIIVPTALALTFVLFGGASFAAYRAKKDEMLSYGKILGGSLIGLVTFQLIGLGSIFLYGMNPFAAMLLDSSTYISVALFTAFIAYDTHLAVRMYEEGNPDHLAVSTTFLLDLWNILLSLLEILNKKDK